MVGGFGGVWVSIGWSANVIATKLKGKAVGIRCRPLVDVGWRSRGQESAFAPAKTWRGKPLPTRLERLTGVAQELEARGVRTPAGRDRWAPPQVSRLLAA